MSETLSGSRNNDKIRSISENDTSTWLFFVRFNTLNCRSLLKSRATNLSGLSCNMFYLFDILHFFSLISGACNNYLRNEKRVKSCRYSSHLRRRLDRSNEDSKVRRASLASLVTSRISYTTHERRLYPTGN